MDQGSSASDNFTAHQAERRRELWGLLGRLPRDHQPRPPQQQAVEKHPGFTLEHLLLDLNGLEPVPALLLIPDRRAPRAPGLLYCHSHGGVYSAGSRELLEGSTFQTAYAPLCAELGLVTLAIDSWCFGQRQHAANGRIGEQDTFKRMLLYGQVLFGMMLFDEYRALDYLASRTEVDPQRLGCLGFSMGALKAWWLAALDPRLRLCVNLCCLTDFAALIGAGHLSAHDIYAYVPGLLRHFRTAQIAELIVPRRHLSLNGRRDILAPVEGVRAVREALLPLYRAHGREQDCRIELYDCGHEEIPAMRAEVRHGLAQL